MSLKKSRKQKIEFNVEEVKEFIKSHEDAKIYLGCDSIRQRKGKIQYATVVVIHYGAASGTGKGAKIFGEITSDTVKDAQANKPINRMLQEVNKVIEMYNKLEDVLIDRTEDVSIHCDINPDDCHGSYVAYGAAKGMIQGLLGIEPDFKPDAFCASYAADKFCRG